MNITAKCNLLDKMNGLIVKKQELDTGCIAACVQSIIATINPHGAVPSQSDIIKESAILADTKKSDFDFLETAAIYLENYIKKNNLDYSVSAYLQPQVLSEHANDFTGVTYYRLTGLLRNDVDSESLNISKNIAMENAQVFGVKIYSRGLSFDDLRELLKKDSYIILGINTQPIQDYFKIDHPGFGHAIIPTEITSENVTFGDPLEGVPELMQIPSYVFKESMSSQGKYFIDGKTEAIIISR